jgi:hypothetical protein
MTAMMPNVVMGRDYFFLGTLTSLSPASPPAEDGRPGQDHVEEPGDGDALLDHLASRVLHDLALRSSARRLASPRRSPGLKGQTG